MVWLALTEYRGFNLVGSTVGAAAYGACAAAVLLMVIVFVIWMRRRKAKASPVPDSVTVF